MDIFYEDVLEEMKENIENGDIGGIKYIDTWDYEDEYSHNDIDRNREDFILKANEYFENNNMPYVMREACENAMICDKETGEIIR